jgi:CHAD domain-containing protein
MEEDLQVSSSTTAKFAKEQGDKLLRSLSTQIVRTIRTPSVDEIHDLRVAIRRFTRILVVLKPCFPRGESRRMRRGLKRIMVQAGEVRDYDVAVRLLTKLAAPEADALIAQMREQRKETAETVAASLRRWMQRDLAFRWRKALETEGQPKGADARFCATPVDQMAKRLLPDMATELFRRGKDAASEDASAREIHRFRIADKGLRYTLDLFAPVYGDSLAGLLDHLKQMQTVLGEINDFATVRRMLSRRKADKQILSALKKRKRKKTEHFQQRFAAEFADAGVLRRWRESLRNPAPLSPAVRTSSHRTLAHRNPAHRHPAKKPGVARIPAA